MKYLPDPTWWTRCLRFDNDAYANLHHVRVTNEGKGNKIKGFKSFDKCFYSFEQAKCWGVRLTIKPLINIQKSVWLEACSCALTGASSWLLVRHLNFFAGIPQGRGLVRTLQLKGRWTEMIHVTLDHHPGGSSPKGEVKGAIIPKRERRGRLPPRHCFLHCLPSSM